MEEKFISANEFLTKIEEDLEYQKQELLRECCETLADSRYVANSCATIKEKAIEGFMENEALGKNTADTFLILQMVLIGGTLMQKWLAEKGAEYEEMADE